MATYRGKVHWFDNLSQEGIITCENLGGVYINNDPVTHYRANGAITDKYCKVIKPGKPLKLESGDYVICEVYEDYNWMQVSKCRLMTKKEIHEWLCDEMLIALEQANDILIGMANKEILEFKFKYGR